jgi:hypothetical protein
MMSSARQTASAIATAFVMILVAGGVFAASEQAADQAELPPGMTAEDMAKWQKASSPGPEHEMLAEMAGSWTFKGTFWMAPDAPPMESTGTAERKMILGGRVLVEKVKSEFQGEPFEGQSMTGFDNVAGQYWGTWVDNMGTGIMLSTGSCTEERCEFTASYNDPMLGGSKKVRMTMTSDGDVETHQTFEPGPDGEFKSMELVYTRVE